MNRDRMFELRVLTGTHAGARVLLPEGEQVLGSADDCDLILSDDGVQAQHARLELQADGSTVLRWLDGSMPPLVIRPGEGAAVGPVAIAVEASDAPWRTDVPIQRPHPPAPEPSGQEADAFAPDGPDDDAAPAPQDAPTTQPAQALRRSAASNITLAALSLLAVASIVLVGWAWQGHRPARPEAVTKIAAQAKASAASAAAASAKPGGPTLPAAAAAAVRDPVTEAVARLGLGERVRVQARPGQAPQVQASLLSDDETDRLASALSRLSPRPGLRLLSVADVQETLDAVLEGHTGAAGRKLSARYLGDGRFSLRGRVADEAERDALQAELAKALPTVPGIDLAVLTDAQAATAMVDDLRAQGVGSVSGHWQDSVLALQVDLSPAEVPRWEKALLAAASRHQLPFRATLNLREGPPLRLPFTVRSVVSSDLPYVVLSDGRKLVAGATVAGWQLMQIRVDAVVFEGADGRRITLER